MTEENGRQEGVGKTGGLPGHHADPRTRHLPADQLDDTVAMGDVGGTDPAQNRTPEEPNRTPEEEDR